MCPNDTIHDTSPGFLVFGMVVTCTVSALGSLGNLLTLCTIIHQCCLPKSMRSIDNITADTVLIFNLALADFFYSFISLPPIFITYLFEHLNIDPWGFQHGCTICTITAFLCYTTAIAEWTTLGVMAIERCTSIYKFRQSNRRSKLFTPTRTIFICCAIWVAAISAQIGPLLDDGYSYVPNSVKCDFSDSSCDPETPAMNLFSNYRGIFFLVESLIPCILITIGYITIIVQLYYVGRDLRNIGSIQTQTEVAMRRSRTTKVILRLLLVYIVCVIPICIFNIIQTITCFAKPLKDVGIFLYCIYWLQYCINNLIYVVSNDKYRFAYKQFIALLRCSKIPAPRRRTLYIPEAGQRDAIAIIRELGQAQPSEHDTTRPRTMSDVNAIEQSFSSSYSSKKKRKPHKECKGSLASICTSDSFSSVTILVFNK